MTQGVILRTFQGGGNGGRSYFWKQQVEWTKNASLRKKSRERKTTDKYQTETGSKEGIPALMEYDGPLSVDISQVGIYAITATGKNCR